MPCYTRVEITTEFQIQNFDQLEIALKAKGWEVQRNAQAFFYRKSAGQEWVRVENGKASFYDEATRATLNEAKRAYAEHVVKMVGKRKGFRVQQAAGSRTVRLSRSY